MKLVVKCNILVILCGVMVCKMSYIMVDFWKLIKVGRAMFTNGLYQFFVAKIKLNIIVEHLYLHLSIYV